jgi:MoxR-like ATPase
MTNLQLDIQLQEHPAATGSRTLGHRAASPVPSVLSHDFNVLKKVPAIFPVRMCRAPGKICRRATRFIAPDGCSPRAALPCERRVQRVLISRKTIQRTAAFAESPAATTNQRNPMRFEGTSAYVATDDLKIAVNAAIALERPLLVKGEPGTGKTVLAIEIAKALGAPLLEWHIKSTTKALQGLYEYDAVTRLRDSQLGDTRVKDIRNYIKRGKLWEAFVADERPVLLIDEIDKADIEFPNDLLQELDRMEFFVYETGETVAARRRPIVVITSNNEKELPDAFLRRCFFHYIRFPDPDTMRAIVEVHFPGVKHRLVAEALKLFYEIRDVPGMKKKPSTSELLDWLKLLMVEDISAETLRERDPKKLIPPLHGALIKNEQDVHLFERLAFMARREGR